MFAMVVSKSVGCKVLCEHHEYLIIKSRKISTVLLINGEISGSYFVDDEH